MRDGSSLQNALKLNVQPEVYPLPVEAVRDYVARNRENLAIKGHLVTRAAVALVCRAVRALGWNGAYRLGTAIGGLLYRLGVRRSVAMTNLDIAFGDRKTAREKNDIYRRSLENLGRQVVNYLRIPLMDDAFWTENFRLGNEEVLRNAYNQGRGVLFLYMHFGPWELAGGKIAHSGYPLSVVAKTLKNPVTNRLIVDARASMLLGCIKHRDAMARIREGLEAGEGIVMVIDQNMKRSQGVFVEWMGRVASTVRSVSYLARETGAPVITGYARQTGPKSFEMTMTDTVEWVSDPDPERELVLNTQNYARVLEKHIYAMPEEWFWLNRRWKVQPEGVASPYDG